MVQVMIKNFFFLFVCVCVCVGGGGGAEAVGVVSLSPPSLNIFSSPGTNVLGEVLSYPRRRRRRQFQVKVFVY